MKIFHFSFKNLSEIPPLVKGGRGIVRPLRKHARLPSRARRPRRERCGQAMIEMLICLIVLPLFITGIIRLGQTLIIKQRLLMAAKHGAILRSTNLVHDRYVKSEIKKFLGDGRPKMERNKITIGLSKITYFGNPISKVVVGYKIKVPKFSNNFFKPFSTEQITLKETVYCANFRRAPRDPYWPDI